MPHYFVSDIHLRADFPDRGLRLASFVNRLSLTDTLVVVGDLCDFWFASRQLRQHETCCAGLQSLADFRSRGGELIILLGNHDNWLGPFYQQRLGVTVQPEPLELKVSGLRVILAHGHRVEGLRRWKRCLESRLFLSTFTALPNWIATRLARQLDARNARKMHAENARLLRVFQQFIERQNASGLFVFGHLHERIDQQIGPNRLVVLGDWKEQISYLVIDDGGAEFCCEQDS